MTKIKFEIIIKWKKKTINYIYSKMVDHFIKQQPDMKWKETKYLLRFICKTTLNQISYIVNRKRLKRFKLKL